MTCDAGSNIRSCVESELKLSYVHCAAHVVNLIVQNSLSIIFQLLEKIKIIVAFFHRSNGAWAALKLSQESEKLGDIKTFAYKLINDVPTRWNSTFNMLDRICLIFDPLMKALDDVNKGEMKLSKLEKEILEEYCMVLRPFELITKRFSDRSCCLSMVIPYFLALSDELKQIKLYDKNSIELAKKLVENIKHYLLEYTENEVVLIASFLDPRTKSFLIFEEDKRQSTIDRMIRRITQILRNYDNRKGELCNSATSAVETLQRGAIWKYMEVRNSSTKNDELNKEILLYQQEILDINEESWNPLDYWKDRQFIFPNLSSVAFGYLSIPVSSVETERTGSSCQRISTKRYRLHSETISALCTLKGQIVDDQ